MKESCFIYILCQPIRKKYTPKKKKSLGRITGKRSDMQQRLFKDLVLKTGTGLGLSIKDQDLINAKCVRDGRIGWQATVWACVNVIGSAALPVNKLFWRSRGAIGQIKLLRPQAPFAFLPPLHANIYLIIRKSQAPMAINLSWLFNHIQGWGE